ncbi:hypothetical protein QR680_017326 [Steinernema hermaphroditum]|uniref:Lethal protein 858 n=1 Tax=Steinernema hermaphroditum TaxID=289476 RepID=A0AA39LP58_9BILA|nr:hypothetical protein QR680_017326 [Steinernema hermaphroditum]
MSSPDSQGSPDRCERKRSANEPHAEAPAEKKEASMDAPAEKKKAPAVVEKKEPVDLLRSRAGGAYIPPAKLRMMQEQLSDKNSEQYQRMNWERLKKKIHGQVNKVNIGNLVNIVRELLQENIIRGKQESFLISAQAFSPTFSHVYAALVAVINSKFPKIGELLVKRLVIQFKRAFRFNNKIIAVTVSKFLAHLVNQQVTHEILALEILIVLLENPTSDSIEVAIAFLKECGAKLSDISPKGLNSVFDRLRSILNEADIDNRVQYMIESIFHIRKDKFRAYPALIEELDLIDEEDQVTHVVNLEDSQDPENGLNVFKFDPDFEENEANYDEVRKQIIGSGGETSSEDEDGDEDVDDEEAGDEQLAETAQTQTIIDNTEQHMVAFRRRVYLSIQSSLDFQEAAHKLLKNHYKEGLERELCYMIVDCCAQERTYNRFFGLLAERFCRLKKEFQECFENSFRETYEIIHRFDITKLRNVVRLFSHLLATDAINWTVLSGVKMTEDDMTSASRVFVKQMFQELSEAWGVAKLFQRVSDPTMQEAFEGLFPRDNPKNTRFAINFFTLIGLGGLTVDLREHLKKVKKRELKLKEKEESSSSSSSESSSSDSDSDSDSDSSDSSDSDSSSSDSSSASSDSDTDSEAERTSAPPKKKTEERQSKDNRDSDDVARRRNHRNDRDEEAKRDRNLEEKDRRDRSSRNRRDRDGSRERKRHQDSDNERRKKRNEDFDNERRKKRHEDSDNKRRKKRHEDSDNERRKKCNEGSDDERRGKRNEERDRDRERDGGHRRGRGEDRDRRYDRGEEREKKRRHDRDEDENNSKRRRDDSDDDRDSRRRRDRSRDRRNRR